MDSGRYKRRATRATSTASVVACSVILAGCGRGRWESRFDTDRLFADLESGKLTLGSEVPHPARLPKPEYGTGARDAAGNITGEGVYRDSARSITLYTYNGMLIAASMHRSIGGPPYATRWYFFDCDRFCEHVRLMQAKTAPPTPAR
jgi:hypothetical protein